MYLLSQINKNPAITTVIKRGIFGGGKGLLSSSLRNIKALLIYETGSLGTNYWQLQETLEPLFYDGSVNPVAALLKSPPTSGWHITGRREALHR